MAGLTPKKAATSFVLAIGLSRELKANDTRVSPKSLRQLMSGLRGGNYDRLELAAEFYKVALVR